MLKITKNSKIQKNSILMEFENDNTVILHDHFDLFFYLAWILKGDSKRYIIIHRMINSCFEVVKHIASGHKNL